MVRIIAHRGASATEPENTLRAFRRARQLGADWVELDVRRTADGALAVHHDAHLHDGRALVEVAAADLPGDVPLLADALDACEGMGVNIEIKNQPGEPDFDPQERLAAAVAALLAGRRDRPPVLVSSFRLETIDRVHALDPLVATGWLVVDVPDPAATAAMLRERGHVALHPWYPEVDQALVDCCRRAGLDVNAWTCDDPAELRRLAGLGVAGICTNVPALAVAELRPAR